MELSLTRASSHGLVRTATTLEVRDRQVVVRIRHAADRNRSLQIRGTLSQIPLTDQPRPQIVTVLRRSWLHRNPLAEECS